MSHNSGLYSSRLRSQSKGIQSGGGKAPQLKSGGGKAPDGGGKAPDGGGEAKMSRQVKFKHMLVQRMHITEAVAEDVIQIFRDSEESILIQDLTVLFDYARSFKDGKAAAVCDVRKAMAIHKECMHEKFTEKVMSDFSRLTLSEGLSTNMSSSTSRVPISYQDRGVDALKLPVRSHEFPVQATDQEAEVLWPAAEWDEILQQQKGCETKFRELLAKQEERGLPEAVNSVFVKGMRGWMWRW